MSYLFQHGGFTMYILFALSLIVIAVAVERALLYRKFRKELEKFLSNFEAKLKSDKSVKAYFPSPSSPLVELYFSNPNEMDNEKRMELNLTRVSFFLERNLPFLATAGAVAPFIGLFGTVLGIMNAFHSISIYRSAGIAVVGAGIAEALVCTAAGLAVAIAAVTLYNAFRSLTGRIVEALEIRQNEFLLQLREEK
ncbi:MAG: MotA/TolQ/ExbB proton channel family protein [bacterium]